MPLATFNVCHSHIIISFEWVFGIIQAGHLSGHRFHADNAVCHPTQSLLLTTSHHLHNRTHSILPADSMSSTTLDPEDVDEEAGELILWRVEPVGPLSVARTAVPWPPSASRGHQGISFILFLIQNLF
ncbi:unnamed protein product [Protopolystoma xenopodis]|uniref:Uncharacterized protein n=1 Tax=Protopolystoma xenopodis TaxID=117903 RepID=A0A3S5ACT2_9PLAT|nr:unnamed protein product [Protopolystoma xenopodis]